MDDQHGSIDERQSSISNATAPSPEQGERLSPDVKYEKPKVVRVRRVLAAGGHTV